MLRSEILAQQVAEKELTSGCVFSSLLNAGGDRTEPPKKEILAPWDEELRKTPHDLAFEVPAPRRSAVPWILAVLVTAAGLAMYIVFGLREPQRATTAEVPKPPAPTEAVQPLGGDASPIAVPPLDQSDAVVRELVRTLSSHPKVTAWLATDGLVRNFTVVVANIADGRPFATLVRPLRPSSSFGVAERGDDLYIDPRSYERYTELARAVASIDAQGSARLYATLKPRIEEAYRELGELERPFDRTLERAIVLLLETSIPAGPIRVEPRGIGYGFAEPRLEAMKPAQRQLLRMGPENARIVQARLREIALALGIPSQRLPASVAASRS